jgi:hypothetical protein
MEPSYGRPRRDDERRAWLPLLAVGALIAVLSLALFLAFRGEDDAGGVTGTLPASFPQLTTVAPTVSTTPPTTAAPVTATAPVATPPARRPTTGGGAPVSQTTTTLSSSDPQTALDDLAAQSGATTSDIVPIGVNLFAMAVRAGSGQLLRWDGSQWAESAIVDAPALIKTVDTVDVTGDGVPDFLVTLEGLDSPAGVYSGQMVQFEFLPFNTVNGLQNFVDNLQVELGQLVSPFTDTSGTRTLVWTWTGQMFETR